MRRMGVVGAACVLAAGCAAKPLPAPRPLFQQSPTQTSWDSDACAWEAQNASGYFVDLSPGDNATLNTFAYARPSGASRSSDPLLGRGGKARFDQVFAECMTKRGYELSSRRDSSATR